MYGKILQKLLQEFFLTMGRAPITPNEWSKLRQQAMELARQTGNDPITGGRIQSSPKSLMDTTKDLPTKDVLTNRPNIIPFPTPKSRKSRNMTPMKGAMNLKGIRGLMEKGDLMVGKAPKTLQSTLDAKKAAHQGHVNKEMWVKDKIQQNKNAIQRFKEKFLNEKPKTVEDFTKEGDWDPSGMAEGGIAPLVGEPSYAADFYDDRTPMKRGKKAKKKKKTHKERVIEEIRKLPAHMWRMSPMGKQIYKKKSDIPKEVLEILEKDPGFDFQDFANIYWSPEGYQHTDEGFSRGRLGSYSGMTGNIEMGMAPFGKKAYKEWELGKPHLDIKAMSDSDKAVVALHELRHKNILENRELWESQPEWVKSVEGPGYLPEGGTTGHELYTRFLDKRFNPTISDPGRHDPYFDKILRDYWEPYAQEYEKTAGRLKAEKRGEGIETLAAEGGRMPFIFGGSAGLKSLIKRMKGKEKRIFSSKLSKEKLKWAEKYMPEMAERIKKIKIEQLENLLEAVKLDKEQMAMRASHKKLSDPGLDFIMKKLDEMPDSGLAPEADLAKYVDIDKDILSLEQMIKNKKMVGRKPHAAGKLVKGGRWFLNSLYDTKKKLIQLDIPLAKKQEMIKQVDDVIKQTEGGGPIPEEVIQTIRKDPKFRSVIQGERSTDPDLAEMEEVIIEYGKRHADGGRVSYSGGGRAGLPAVTYGMSQMNMQGPQMPAVPQPQGISGTDLQLNQMNLMQQKMQQHPWMQQGLGGMQPYQGQFRKPFAGGGESQASPEELFNKVMMEGYIPTAEEKEILNQYLQSMEGKAEGGRIGLAGGGMGRRAFMKLMAGLAALPFVGRGAKKAAPFAEKITEKVIERGADGMPSYIPDLIEIVKMKGIRSIEEGFKKSDYSTKHTYKGVEVVERPNGTISIRTDVEGVGSDDAGEMFDGITKQMEMEIVPGEFIQKGSTVSDDAAKVVKEPDQYFEYTARPDMDGKMKDVEEYIDDIDHEGFKDIADEIKEIPGYPLRDKKGLASGGIARMLGE